MNSITKNIITFLVGMILPFQSIQAQLYDNSFNENGVWTRHLRYSDNLTSIYLQPDGKILYSGSTADSNSSSSHFAIGRITSTGINDSTFNADGEVEYVFNTSGYEGANDICYLNGKIYAVGLNESITTISNLLVRLNDNGSLDATFNGTGKLSPVIESNENESNAVFITSDSNIVVLGNSSSNSSVFNLSGFKVDQNANFVNSFGNNGVTTLNVINTVYSSSQATILSSNTIFLISGKDLIKIKSNGHLDSTFGTNGIIDLTSVSSTTMSGIAVQKDGKIVLCGAGNSSQFSVFRLNTDGSIDITFGTNGNIIVPFGGVSSEASTLVIDTSTVNGNIFVAGNSSYNGGASSFIALVRLNPVDGSIEAQAEFKPNNLNSQAVEILLQPNGNLVIGAKASGGNSNLEFIITRIVPNFATLIATNIEDAANISNSVHLYPNPASQNVTVNSIYNIQEIKVLDVLGNEVLNQKANGNTQINVSSLPKGLYNFVITTDKGTGSKKVSVQ
jgi:uncharacterized delta-60 repeat protein